MHILETERLLPGKSLLVIYRTPGGGLLLHFIEPDGGFQHQQDVEALFANVLDHLGDLLGLGNRFVDGLPQLLNETAESLVQDTTPNLPALLGMKQAFTFPTLLLMRNGEQSESAGAAKLSLWSRRSSAVRSALVCASRPI